MSEEIKIPDLSLSNDKVIKLIKSKKPFSIIRLGACESYYSAEWTKSNGMHLGTNKYLIFLIRNAGIYLGDRPDYDKLKIYCKKYHDAIKTSDLMAIFPKEKNYFGLYYNSIFFKNKYDLDIVTNKCLEPFYQIYKNIKPWTHELIGKKVLIINPFVDSFKKQEKKFKMFRDKDIFLENQEIKYYKTFNTSAFNYTHSNWFETFIIMCNDIKNIDFDIALLGCGGYGLPLCNYIKNTLNKSAIYIGGGLQLLFGVMGKRWEKHETIQKIIKDNNGFIRPSKNESIKNKEKVEDGCYW